MRTPVVDGQSIDQFIPAHLRDMFYHHPMPQYKYAIHDGYAPYSFPTKGLVLFLPLWALKGNPIKSVDAYKHTGTVTGTLWRPDGRWFDGLDDKISCGNHASLQITNNMTVISRIKTPAVFPATTGAAFSAFNIFMGKYLSAGNQRSWYIGLSNAEVDGDRDNIAIGYGDAADGTAEGTFYWSTDLTAATEYHVALTFASGTHVLYVDGAVKSITTFSGATPATLFNSSDNLWVGAFQGGTSGYFLNIKHEDWIYNRALAPAEITHHYSSRQC